MSAAGQPAAPGNPRGRTDLTILIGIVAGVGLLGLALGSPEALGTLLSRMCGERAGSALGRALSEPRAFIAARAGERGAGLLLLTVVAAGTALVLAGGRGGQLAAVCSTAFKEISRGGALWAAGAAAAAVGAGALLMEHEGGAPGRVKMIASLALGAAALLGSLLAVALPALSFSRESETRSIYVSLSKPVPRWVLCVGKLAGVGAALGAAVAMIWLAALGAALLALRAEAAAARAGGRSGDEVWLTAYWSRLDTRAPLAAGPDGRAPRPDVFYAGQRRRFALEVRPGDVECGLLVLRIHARPGDPRIQSAPATVRCAGAEHRVIVDRAAPLDLVVPASAAVDGRLEVELEPAADTEGNIRGLRTDPRGTVELARRGGGLAGALAKAMLLVWLQLMVVAAVTLAAATALSFPVAAVTGTAAVITGHLSGLAVGILRGALDAGRMPGGEEAVAAVGAGGPLAQLVRHEAAGLLALLPDFDATSAYALIADGAHVPWTFVAAGTVSLLVLRVVPLTALGCLVFSRREVGV